VLANCLRHGVGAGFHSIHDRIKAALQFDIAVELHALSGPGQVRLAHRQDDGSALSQRTWIWCRSTSVQALEEILVFHALQQREIDKFRHLFPLEMRKTVTQVLDIVL
jgi:hypothetical protein